MTRQSSPSRVDWPAPGEAHRAVQMSDTVEVVGGVEALSCSHQTGSRSQDDKSWRSWNVVAAVAGGGMLPMAASCGSWADWKGWHRSSRGDDHHQCRHLGLPRTARRANRLGRSREARTAD